MTVKIVTDSVADLPPQVVKELDITVIPVNVCFGTEVYRDGVDINTEQFYEKLAQCEIMPTTAVPPPGVFAETYDKLAEEADEIMFISLSSKLSGIYDTALKSVGLMKKKCHIEVIDSGWAIMAQGFIVMTAARAAQAGASFDEVLDVVNRNISRVHLCAMFDTLKYLKRGGRIGTAAAIMGSILKIQPIIGIKDGVVVPFTRKRSWAKALDYLYDFAMSFHYIEEMSVGYFNAVEDAEMLIERLNTKFPKERVYRSRTSPVIGTHTGPNCVILALLGDR
jgi:DegV family protein with EDD domain